MTTTSSPLRATSAIRPRVTHPNRLVDAFLSVIVVALAIVAGALHLAHNYLPMEGPSAGAPGPPPGAAPAGGGNALMSLVGPHLSAVFVLNFVAFVALAVIFAVLARRRPAWRVTVDVLLLGLSAATLYAWNAFGRANPSGTGTLALIVELALMAAVIVDAVVARRRA